MWEFLHCIPQIHVALDKKCLPNMKYTSMLQLANQSLPQRERERPLFCLIQSSNPFSRALTSSPQGRRKRWTPERVKGEQHLFSFPHIPSLQLRPTPGPGAALRALAGGGKTENYKWQLHFYSGGGWRGEEGWMDRWGKKELFSSG